MEVTGIGKDMAWKASSCPFPLPRGPKQDYNTMTLVLRCHTRAHRLQSHHTRINMSLRCFVEQSAAVKDGACRKILANVTAAILLNTTANQVIAAALSHDNSIGQLASLTENRTIITVDKAAEDGNGTLMMGGMSVKNFDPFRYSGRWFEVASLKRGFAGQGQEDCHCTQGIYTFDVENRAIQVDTLCVHGGPDGYVTGIRGKVQCLTDADLEKAATEVERQEMIQQKCYLRFPTLPFIPKEPYDVIATDYDNFAIVSGAKDKSFVQIYSRTPNPGPEFIEKYKSYLADIGYNPSQIKDTPQDCEVVPPSDFTSMMSQAGMKEALTNQFPGLGLKRSVQLNPFTSVFDTLKKLIQLYFK